MSATTSHRSSTTTASHTPATIAYLLTAFGVAAGGLLHLKIWNNQKKDLPSQIPHVWVVQEGFLFNFAVSMVVAAAVVAVALGAVAVIRRYVIPAAIAVQIGALAALILSRRSDFLGYQDKVWDTDAKQILWLEIATLVVALIALAVDVMRNRQSNAADQRP